MYIGSVDCDPNVCATRNVHGRTEKDIQDLHKSWEPTPSHFNKIDFSSFLQDEAIEHFEMADVENDNSKDTKSDSCTLEKANDRDEPTIDSKSTSSKSQNEVRSEVISVESSCKNDQVHVKHNFVYIIFYS